MILELNQCWHLNMADQTTKLTHLFLVSWCLLTILHPPPGLYYSVFKTNQVRIIIQIGFWFVLLSLSICSQP